MVHVGPGLYYENAAPDAPQTGFSVPNHTHLISDNGADETVLQVDLSQLSFAGVVYVVRSQQIGMAENATDITIDGFTITLPTGEVDLQNHSVVGVNMGANFTTEIAPTGNVIRNNVISLSNKNGRTSYQGEGKGVFVAGGAIVDCNVFYRIDSVGIAMGAVNTGMNGNATQPGEVTRNSFYHFTSSQNLSPRPSDMHLAIGIDVPTTVRGNLFDFTRQVSIDRGFGVVCFDCTGLVAENNVFTGMPNLFDAPISLVSVTPTKGPFVPTIDHNTFFDSASGLQGYDVSTNGLGGDNFAPTVTNNIIWVTEAVRDVDAGTYDFNNWMGAALPPGSSNISSNPQFQDTVHRDFRLTMGSPSLTAGQGATQQGAFGGGIPFGSAQNPSVACVLRGTAVGYPDLGQCTGQSDGIPCDSVHCADATHGYRGQCFAGRCDDTERTAFDCDDGNAMTVDSCMPAAGCVHRVLLVDAGTPDAGVTDAGVSDAGVIDGGVTDAGTADAGEPDAGTEPDAGQSDAGNIILPDSGMTFPDGGLVMTSPYSPRGAVIGTCGCSSGAAPLGFIALAVLALVRRRRRETAARDSRYGLGPK